MFKIYSKHYGWSLLELMIVLSLLALLSAAGLPSLHASIKRAQSEHASKTLIKAFELARQEAIARNHTVTLCGILNNKCESKGALNLSVFIDDNDNRVIDEGEEVIRMLSNTGDNSLLIISASLGRNYFRFKDNGSAMESGSITYCPENNDVQLKNYAQIVKLNYTGRAYLLRNDKEKIKQTKC